VTEAQHRSVSRTVLLSRISAFLADHDPATLADIRGAVNQEIDDAGPDALALLGDRLASGADEWTYYPGDPLARRIHHVIADRLMPAGSGLQGLEHIQACEGRPVVIFANHLSYSDANLIEILLRSFGAQSLADRLIAMAGPKIYLNRTRRFSSLCYGTIKVPQTSSRSSEEAVMSPREVARAARLSIEAAHDRLRAGGALIVFAEGARSRTGTLQEMLTGAARYLDVPDVAILPMGLMGTERMFPVGDDTRLHLVPVVLRAGRPIDGAELQARAHGDRRLLMDVVGLAVARLVPAPYRGVYDDEMSLGAARAVLAEIDERDVGL
jgi:1-acyl-sn-glycerol-3-phosphate acyltransferase